MSDYLEVKIADHCLRTASFTKPSNIYIALCTAATSDASTGATITEPTTGGYTRQGPVGPSDAAWNRASSTNGLCSNASAIAFTASGGNFGTITHLAIVDASTNGNILFHGALTSSKTINDGETLSFPIGSLTVTFA